MTAVAVAAVAAVVVPLQAFLGNASLYPFGLGRLLAELAAVFAALSALCPRFSLVARRVRMND